MHFRSLIGAFTFALVVATPALAEGHRVRLSIGLRALEPTSRASTLDAPSRVELGPYFLPEFLAHEPRQPHDALAGLMTYHSDPEWLRARLSWRDPVSLQLEGFTPAPPVLVPVDEATRQLEALEPVRVLPLLEPVRVLTSVLTTQANELLFRGMSFEVGDRVESRYTPLKGLAGDIQRGQYVRSDDVTGRQFNFDVRLVVTWRPTSRVRIEAGYDVAYLSGETTNNFGANGPLTDRTSSYLVHGPCAAFNLDF